MHPDKEATSPAKNRSLLLCRGIALVTATMAALVLAGWALGRADLKSLTSTANTPMVANSAICFLAASACHFLLCGSRSPVTLRVVQLLGLLIALTGLITLAEYLFAINLGIDQLLFRQDQRISSNPGRMSIVSAANFLVIGVSCWLETKTFPKARIILDYAMLACFFTTLYPFAGTFFGASHFSSQNTNMATASAIGFFLLTAAYFIRHADRGWVSLFVAPQIAGVLIRRILIPVIVLYPIVAFLTVRGERAGLYNTEGGMVFMMVTSLALFTTIVLITAQTISRLDDEKEQFKKFFELSSEVLMIARADGSIRLVSAAFTSALGYSNQEGISNSFFFFVHADSTAEAVACFDRLRADPNPVTLQAQMKGKDGGHRHFLWSFTRDRKSGDVYGAGYDITEIKEAQQVRALARKLQAQNEQLASFAHIASHNLRSHVSNLTSLLQLHKEANPAEQPVLLGMVEKVTHHLQGTLADLIESIRIKEADDKVRHEILFGQVLEKTTEILSTQIQAAQADIRSSFAIPSVQYSGTYLESIFLNLISNALKYRSPHRTLSVRLETRLEEGHVILTIADNGMGIDLERYGDKIFGFYKTFHSVKDAKGLGLFITKAQVEAMGGTIAVTSQVDRGTTFRVDFGPIASK